MYPFRVITSCLIMGWWTSRWWWWWWWGCLDDTLLLLGLSTYTVTNTAFLLQHVAWNSNKSSTIHQLIHKHIYNMIHTCNDWRQKVTILGGMLREIRERERGTIRWIYTGYGVIMLEMQIERDAGQNWNADMKSSVGSITNLFDYSRTKKQKHKKNLPCILYIDHNMMTIKSWIIESFPNWSICLLWIYTSSVHTKENVLYWGIVMTKSNYCSFAIHMAIMSISVVKDSTYRLPKVTTYVNDLMSTTATRNSISRWWWHLGLLFKRTNNLAHSFNGGWACPCAMMT